MKSRTIEFFLRETDRLKRWPPESFWNFTAVKNVTKSLVNFEKINRGTKKTKRDRCIVFKSAGPKVL